MIKRAVDGFALTANLRKTRGTSLPIACICDFVNPSSRRDNARHCHSTAVALGCCDPLRWAEQ
jgi:hypothetical protein